MNTKEFIALNESVFKEEMTPYVIYRGDISFRKTLFGFKQYIPMYRKELLPYDHKKVKQALKRSPVRLKNGDRFTVRWTDDGRIEIIPDRGIVCGNLAGRQETWDAEMIDFVLDQDNVEAILFVSKSHYVALMSENDS